MGVETEKYIRKPLYVDAVRISTQNFDDIAKWCQGVVQVDEETRKQYIKVRVHLPKNPRQTRAYPGDWILYTDKGYKVYTNRAFRAAFDVVEEKTVTTPPTPIEQQWKHDHSAVIEPGATTPQDEEVEVVEATPQAIADVVNEQQPTEEVEPLALSEEEVQARTKEPEQLTDKRILSRQEQDDMGPDAVREMLRTGDVVLEQDLEAA